MLSDDITRLLEIDYKGLFEDQSQCFALLSEKRASGDEDTPPELMKGVIFDLSPDLFLWVTQKHIENNSAHLIAKDVMSNIAAAGLNGTYGEIVDMLADAGHHARAAQIWRADVASHMEVYREFLRAKRTVDKYNRLPEAKRKTPAPNRFQRDMARNFSAKKQLVQDAIAAFEAWSERYVIADAHKTQIALWKAELETETRAKLPPPDKTPASEHLLWTIIEQAHAGSVSETLLNIEDRLKHYTAKTIRDAAKIVQSFLTKSYQEDIWALAYLLQDGCSDDAFDDFRHWMILQGQNTFDTMLANPDAFDPDLAAGADFGAAGGLLSTFENAYLARADKPLILPREKRPKIDLDETGFAQRLPTLATKLLVNG